MPVCVMLHVCEYAYMFNHQLLLSPKSSHNILQFEKAHLISYLGPLANITWDSDSFH